MFKAGSVVGEAEFDDRKWNKGVKRLKKSNKSLTGSFIKAQLSTDAIKASLKKLINVGKAAIKNFAIQEQAEKSLATALGNTSQELLDQASALQEVSVFGDEAIIAGQAFLAQMGLEEEQIKKLTPAILDFAQAKKIDLKTAFDLVSKTVGSSTNALSRYGLEIEGAAKSNERAEDTVAALTEAFGGQAAAARDTLGGALQSLKNVQGDLLEDFGALVNVVGRDFVEGMISSTSAIRDFLAEEKNMARIQTVVANIGAGFDVFGAIIKDVGTEVFAEIKEAVIGLTESFEKLFSDLKPGTIVFDIIGLVIKNISEKLILLIKIIKAQIQLWVDWFNILKETGKLVGAIFQAFTNPAKWKELKKQLSETGDSFGNLAKNLITNSKEIVKEIIDDFKEVPLGALDNSKKYQKIWDKSINETKENFIGANEEMVQSEDKKNMSLVGSDTKTLEKRKKILEEWNGLQKKTIKDQVAAIKVKRDKFIQAGVDEAEANKQANKEIRKAWADQAASTLNTISSLASQIANIYSSIFDAIMQFQEQELEQLKNKNSEQIEEMTAAKEERIEQFDEETESKLAKIAEEEEQGLITQAEAEEQRKALEEQRATEKAALEKSLDDKIAEQKKKNRAKEIEQEKKMFEAQKANKIAMVWINAAIGIVGAWAQSISQLGPIAGAIFAGILTAAILGVAIAQTVVISQQKFVPGKQEGGMAAGMTRVNEAGGEIITLPDGSQVIPNDISRQIAANAGGNNIVINNSFRGAVIKDNMSLKRVATAVSSELGRRLDVAL